MATTTHNRHQPRLPHMPAAQEGDPLLKAAETSDGAPHMPAGVPHRIIPSMYRWGSYKGYADPHRATGMTYDILEMMGRAHIPRLVIQHIIRMVQRYARRPRRRDDYGFTIELRDPEAHMTAEQRAEADALTEFIERGGYEYLRTTDAQVARWDGRGEEKAVRFDRLLAMLTEDSLVFDAAAIRIETPNDPTQHPIYQEFPEARERGSAHPPVWFAPLAGKRIRKAETVYHDAEETQRQAGGPIVPDAQEYEAEIREELGKHVGWVELSPENKVVREFAHNEVAYLVRNPSSDDWTVGYGRSELEYLVEAVTGLVSGVSFNTEYFTRNHKPEGILNLTGEWKQQRIDQFRQDLVTQVGGPGQYHKLPILFSDDPQSAAEFVATRTEQRLDMYWERWISWLITAVAQFFGVPPEAIGFQSFRSGGGSALQEADPATRLVYGEDVGLVPLMLAIEAWINEHLIWPIDSSFVLRFVNLRERDEKQQWDLVERKLNTGYYSINEARREMGEGEWRYPLDQALWRQVEKLVERRWATMKDDAADRERVVAQVYEHQGGEFASFPDVPGSVHAQVAMQELGEQAPGGEQGMGMEQMMGLGPGGDTGPGAFPDGGSGDEAGMPLGGGEPTGPDDETGGGMDDLLDAFAPPDDGDLGKSVPDALTQTYEADDPDATPAGMWSRVLSRLDAWRAAVRGRLEKSIDAAITHAMGDDA